MEAHAGIGEQAQRVGDAEHDGGERRGLAAGGGQLAGDRADGQEHHRRGHHGQGEVQRRADADVHLGAVPADETVTSAVQRPQHRRPRLRVRRHAWAVALRAGGLAGHQQVPAAAVLLPPEEPGAGEQSPHRTEDHQGHGDLETGEAGDRLEARGGTEQGARSPCEFHRWRPGRPGCARVL